jgi:hypothetical protein
VPLPRAPCEGRPNVFCVFRKSRPRPSRLSCYADTPAGRCRTDPLRPGCPSAVAPTDGRSKRVSLHFSRDRLNQGDQTRLTGRTAARRASVRHPNPPARIARPRPGRAVIFACVDPTTPKQFGATHQTCRYLAVHGQPDRTLELGAADTSAAICCPEVANSPRGTDTTEPPFSARSRGRPHRPRKRKAAPRTPDERPVAPTPTLSSPRHARTPSPEPRGR